MTITYQDLDSEEFYGLRLESLSDFEPLNIIRSINSISIEKSAIKSSYDNNIECIKAPELIINDKINLYGTNLWQYILSACRNLNSADVTSIANEIILYLQNIYDIYCQNGSYPYQYDENGEFDLGVNFFSVFFKDDSVINRINIELRIKIFDLFGRIFKTWDLENEHPETTAMLDKVLYFYLSTDFPKYKQTYIDLLCHRLTSGQHRVLEGHAFLSIAERIISMQGKNYSNILIKDILDKVISEKEQDIHFIYSLCIPIYGDREDLISEIVNYYKNNFELKNDYPRLIEHLNNIGKIVRIYNQDEKLFSRLRYIDKINTGFHTFLTKEKQWVSNDIN